MNSRVRVECYSGYKADQRPARFFLDEREYQVEDVLDQWYSPAASYFRVKASDGNVYILRHTDNGLEDTWTLESFRRAR